MNDSSVICATAVIVQEVAKRLPALRKHVSQRSFSADLSLVAHGIRTGYLLDLFTPKDPVDAFSRLLSALRSGTKTKELFASVVHIFEACSGQSFFINTKLLAERIQVTLINGSANGQRYPVFLQLGSPIELLEKPPDDVIQLLEKLRFLVAPSESPPLSFSLPDNTAMENAVPLAAVLLDYPVSYVPSPTQRDVLSGIALDFYECLLIFHDGDATLESQNGNNVVARTIIKFSCPSRIRCREGEVRLTSDKIMAELRDMYAKRLQRTGNSSVEVGVVHTIQILDHVTF